MEENLKLYMVMLGCIPKGRFTEQHDIFFGIGNSLKNLIPQIKEFWPETKGRIHIDAWREVAAVENFSIEIIAKSSALNSTSDHLFFINLGGYKENEFEEYHYKILTVAKSMGLASKKSKKSTFYKHYGFQGAPSHIDDKYGIDVDNIYKVFDILPAPFKEHYRVKITKSEIDLKEDELHIGYLKLNKITN